MAILNDYTITIKGGKSFLNKDIYLTREDKDVQLYFTIDELPFLFVDSNQEEITNLKYQIILQKPNGTKVKLDQKTSVDGKMNLTITSDVVDELAEVGDYSFQIKLFDNETDSACVSLPVVYNQIHVLDVLTLTDGNSSEIDNTTINVGHVSIGDDIDVFNDKKGYNATNWQENDVITNAKMNKVENALTYLFDNDVIYNQPVDDVITLTLDKIQSSEISNSTKIILPSVSYVCDFTLYLKCDKECVVTFDSTSDVQTVDFDPGYKEIKLHYIGDWIITC